MELNEREKNIVDLIGKLAEAASDENTTEETIEHIMGSLQKKSNENSRQEMKEAEDESIPIPTVKFPETNLDEELSKIAKQTQSQMPSSGHKCQCHTHQNQPLLFTRIREVKSPTKAHPTDAGIDFFVPDKKAWTEEYKSMIRKYSRNPADQDLIFIGVNGVEVAPGAHVAIPSGIKTIIPQGLAMMMVNKSGVATKLKLDHSACLIDSEYRDELIFCFFNNNQERVVIEPGMKITQGLIVPVINLKLQECLNCVYDDIAKAGSDRGGGFGSSGSK